MKKIQLAVLGFTLSCAAVAQAAGYGVVSLERVVESSSYLKQQNSALQQSLKPQTTKLEQLGKELETLQQRAQQSANLSEADKQKLSAQYQAKLKEFNTLQQSLQTKVQADLQKMNDSFEQRIKQAAEQLRKENNLDVVLNKNSALAYDPKYDLTDKMIQKVNAIK
ncbi:MULTISPECIES: OmpH family outer membrane protein [Acinetobacter]|uniref:OmpH family outer membrane protein n=1 Tax=Acinetobacter TaxID=469 RepID=UPI0013B08F3B|nr:OmpH family outer membrane protein [Acinetobacter indicus]MDM1770651.1 OmpH family outer membrane protein [Acinetobacter indicus]MDM1773450.1 OmpH family outer membrane protein [Acinetobacter indicus]QIC75980.1 OmpH family outer membrane protein [Acinetobacter indicus]QIC78854.1 OmpH family outer membrane protein [Acinetobacter indicus]